MKATIDIMKSPDKRSVAMLQAPTRTPGDGVCVQFIYTRVRIHRHLMQTQTELGALFGEQSALETTGYDVL